MRVSSKPTEEFVLTLSSDVESLEDLELGTFKLVVGA